MLGTAAYEILKIRPSLNTMTPDWLRKHRTFLTFILGCLKFSLGTSGFHVLSEMLLCMALTAASIEHTKALQPQGGKAGLSLFTACWADPGSAKLALSLCSSNHQGTSWESKIYSELQIFPELWECVIMELKELVWLPPYLQASIITLISPAWGSL